MPPSAEHVVGSTANKTGKHVALTFDDGPDPRWTPEILQLLRQYRVRATFCMVGTQAAAHPELVRQVAAEGHALCDHTMTHDEQLAKRPQDVQIAEIAKGRQAILDAAPGTEVMYFRAPAGNFAKPMQRIAVSLGMQPAGWSVDTLDWTRPGTPAIMASVQQHLGGHDVVLMHDGGGDRTQTVEALKQLLPWLAAQGYQFDIPA